MDESLQTRDHGDRWKKLLPYVALGTLIVLSYWASQLYKNLLLEQEQARYHEHVDDIIRHITARMEREEVVLHGGAGVFHASEDITRNEWRAYYEAQQIDVVRSGVQGIGISRVIEHDELAQHIQSVRAEGFPDYTVWPAGEREVFTPFIFMEPFNARNQRAFGFDIFSGPRRRAAMERARDTGNITITAKLTLITETGEESQPGFLMFLPLYDKGTAPRTVEERREAIHGYVFAAFRVHDLIWNVFANMDPQIAFTIYDGNEVSPAALMYHGDELSNYNNGDSDPLFASQRTLELYGRQWTVAFETTPLFEAAMNRHTPNFILAAGLTISLLIFLYLKTLERNRKRAQTLIDELTGAREAAERADRAKSAFLANMSHEIRTPMNAILGFAQILARDSGLTHKQREQINSINRAGRHLLALINDILDMSKIEAGMNVLNPTVFGLHDLLDDLQMMFRSRADAKGLQLIMERDDDMPYYVRGDEGKLRQILVNLLGNAIKFTETGGVAVRVQIRPTNVETRADDNSIRLLVEVEDSGPGIQAEDVEQIFNTFGRAHSRAGAGGTGLGLSISRSLAEMMGGSLSVDSEPGSGSCFRFDVILEEAESTPTMEIRETQQRQIVGLAPDTGPWRILIADDVQDNRELLCDLLQPIGFEVREAETGVRALEVFEQWAPHAVLMDMRMPVMDGYEATRRLKATEAGRKTPIIAVTASAFKDSEEEVLATGVSAYLRKPFQPDKLFEILEDCLDVSYVYARKQDELRGHSTPRELTSESLAALPDELIAAMREAVAEGDMAHLSELIDEAEKIDSAVAGGLQSLADRYDYGKLSELLGDRENTDGQ